MRLLIRWGSYPLIFLACTWLQYFIVSGGLPYWPLSALVAAAGIGLIAILERIQPYEPDWNIDHGDTMVDVLHAAFSLTLIFGVIEIVVLSRRLLPSEWDFP